MALQPAQQGTAMRTEIEQRSKLTPNIPEAVQKPVGDFCMEEINRSAARRAIAVQPPSAAVERCERLGRAHLGGDQSAGVS